MRKLWGFAMKSKIIKFKFRWAEQLIYEGIIEAESEEEAEKIFKEDF